MGESRQVGNEKAVEGQAENRRVVVRVLQNKAIGESRLLRHCNSGLGFEINYSSLNSKGLRDRFSATNYQFC